MSQTTSPAPARVRPRKWRRLLLALLLLVVSGAGGILYFLWSSEAALTEIMAEIDRRDPGWRLAELEGKRKLLPAVRNSALHIVSLSPLRGGQLVVTPAMEKLFENLPPQVQLNEQQVAELEKRFQILRKAVVEARKLRDMPEGRYPIQYSVDFIGTLLPHVQQAREVCELLQWDAAWRVHTGDTDGALESCLALHHAARSMGDEPFLISLLVRHACNNVALSAIERTLAQGEFGPTSEPTLKRLQAALAQELLEPVFVTALRGERAGMHQLLLALTEGKVNAASYKAVGKTLFVLQALAGAKPDRSLSNEVEATLVEYFPIYVTRQHAVMLRYLDDLVETAKLPPEEGEKRFKVLGEKVREQPFLVSALVPTSTKTRNADFRARANLRCAVAALAAERFRLAKSQWPEALDILVKTGYLDAVPTDPYDGKPIRLKRTADGLIIYSVGQDKIDNDGFIDRDRPLEPGTDLGFRLWDISRRRQPPNPPVADNENPLK